MGTWPIPWVSFSIKTQLAQVETGRNYQPAKKKSLKKEGKKHNCQLFHHLGPKIIGGAVPQYSGATAGP